MTVAAFGIYIIKHSISPMISLVKHTKCENNFEDCSTIAFSLCLFGIYGERMSLNVSLHLWIKSYGLSTYFFSITKKFQNSREELRDDENCRKERVSQDFGGGWQNSKISGWKILWVYKNQTRIVWSWCVNCIQNNWQRSEYVQKAFVNFDPMVLSIEQMG